MQKEPEKGRKSSGIRGEEGRASKTRQGQTGLRACLLSSRTNDF
jgi:hypothetical protein